MTLKEAKELKQGDVIYFVKPYHTNRVCLYDVIPVIYIGSSEKFGNITVKYTDKDVYIPVYISTLHKTENKAKESVLELIKEVIITEEKHIKRHRENIEILNKALTEHELKKTLENDVKA